MSLSNGVNSSDYSILLDFSFDSTSGYKKIVDFKNRTLDDGLYNLNGTIRLYPETGDTNAVFTENTLSRLVITRDDTTDLFTAYVNGTQEYQLTDSSDRAVFDQADNIAQFFINESDGSSENPSGFVDTVAIWDGALSASEVASLGSPGTDISASVPFEFSPTLGLFAVGGIWGVSRLRKRVAVSKITK